jgi:hypothetical protein
MLLLMPKWCDVYDSISLFTAYPLHIFCNFVDQSVQSIISRLLVVAGRIYVTSNEPTRVVDLKHETIYSSPFQSSTTTTSNMPLFEPFPQHVMGISARLAQPQSTETDDIFSRTRERMVGYIDVTLMSLRSRDEPPKVRTSISSPACAQF